MAENKKEEVVSAALQAEEKLKSQWYILDIEGMKPGDTLAVTFPAPKAGKYHVLGHFLRARDYGVHQLAINGQKAGEPMDFYNPDVKPTKEIDLGVYDLREGDNEFSATVTGANAKAVPSYMFGLDYLLLKAVE